MIYSSFTNLLDYWEESESKLTTKIGPHWLSAGDGVGWGTGWPDPSWETLVNLGLESGEDRDLSRIQWHKAHSPRHYFSQVNGFL